MSLPRPLVETDWLAERLGGAGPVVVDASWRMPGRGRARDDYDARHIEGAVFFDIDAIADASSDLPHMLPSPEAFAQAMGALGVSERHDIVVYDDQGVFSSARVWWTLRSMGCRSVAVLDGGLKAWLDEGRPTTAAATVRHRTDFHAAPRAGAVATAHDVRGAIAGAGARVLDARPAGRFEGRDPEPRPGLRRGHIPGSASLPFSALLAPDGRLRGPAELAAALAAAGVDERPVIATCGSGVTAAVVVLALAVLGRDDVSLYDGAFAEWGRDVNDLALFPVSGGTA